MKSPLLQQIVNAVLYEGYILYPYRASSIKNKRERFTFGRIYPKDYSDSQKGVEPCVSQTECLMQIRDQRASLEITVGFLQPMWREVGHVLVPNASGAADASSFRALDQLSSGGVIYQSWQEATEREITVSLGPLISLQNKRISFPFSFLASCTVEPLNRGTDAEPAAVQRRQEHLMGRIEIEASPLTAQIFRITVRVLNLTPLSHSQCENQDAVVMRTFASTHAVLHVTGGDFISLLEPADEFAKFSSECRNIGTWPVLVGNQKDAARDTLLSSPIILYDYPQIAPESNGSFCDGTEIDEILTLRVMTMTDGEKMEMRQVDEYARRILERSEAASAEDFLKMHGVMRGVKSVEEFFNPPKKLESIFLVTQEVKPGDRVRIQPKRRADAIDMILAGKIGIVEAIEQDAEEGVHLALVLEDDPGRDMGMARQSGHRFFYGLDEVEPLMEATA